MIFKSSLDYWNRIHSLFQLLLWEKKMLWNLSFQCSWMDFVEESFYLWHSDITSAARHYLIWASPPLRLSYLSAAWPCTIWCPYMEIIRHPWAMRSLLKEQTFFERMGEFPEKRREEPRMPSVRSHNGGQLLWWQWTHFRLISQLFYTQRSPEDGNSREQLSKYLENLLFIEATKITPGKIHNSWDLRKSEDKKISIGPFETTHSILKSNNI